MTTVRRQPTRPSLPSSIISLFVVMVGLAIATTAGVMTARSASAADGAQVAPTLTPSPVATSMEDFGLSNGACDGTGGDGWRVQTFIVNDGVNLSTLVFDQGPFSDRVGTDRDNSDGSIRAPLWKGGAPGTGYNPAASPAGLINPSDLSAFDFSDAGWTLTDDQYQIGYACLDEMSALRQWWSLTVTIDADASPNPFMAIAVEEPAPTDTSTALTADPTTSVVGAEVTFTATVSPPEAAGEIEFLLDDVSKATDTVSAGSATWTTSALPAGTNSITAKFAPTDASAFNASAGTLSYVVTIAAGVTQTSVTLTSDPATEAAVGQTVTFTATVQPAVAGTVTFLEGTQTLGGPVDVTDGRAAFSTSGLREGDHMVVAAFSPSDTAVHQGSSSAPLTLSLKGSTPSPAVVSAASTPSGTAGAPAQVAAASAPAPASASEPVGATGMGLGLAGVALILLYVGRVLYLLGRPRPATG